MKTLILTLLEFLISKIDAKLIKIGFDAFFDAIENYIEKTPNKYDDVAVGGIIKMMRTALDIPDND